MQWCFPCGSACKESACNVGDLGLIAGLGRSPEEGKGYLLQYSGLENSMGYTVHGVAKSRTRLSDFCFQCRGMQKYLSKGTYLWYSWVASKVTQSCLTLGHPMGCGLPASSIHGIFQARVLEWVPDSKL